MDQGQAAAVPAPTPTGPVSGGRLWAWTRLMRRHLLEGLLTVHGLGAFALIVLAVFFKDFGRAARVVHPLIRHQLFVVGVRLLPLVLLLSLALGLMVIGQTVSLLSRVGAQAWLGTVMVGVVIRELGPILTALLVLARSGTANVVELGTARAQGEVESLEAIGVDPIHYLVVPRVAGLALGIFALTMYLIVGSVLSGYAWAFIQDVPMQPGEYFGQMIRALRGLDFLVVLGKSVTFGMIIGLVTSFHGLAQPLRLVDVSRATVRAVGHSIVLCILAEVLFVIVYLTF